MRLYHAPASPFVRKVMALIHEAGIADVDLVAASGGPVDPGTMPVDLNPLGKIPALVTDDGMVIYDSRVICRYLDDLSSAGLYPPAPALWPVLVLEATADGIMEAALLIVYESRFRPEEMRATHWVDGQWTKITRALDAIERQWMDLLSGPVTMAHLAVASALGYLDFRLSDRAWRAAHPDLAAWEAAFSARPSMAATTPKG